jgi:hypothetical protein
MTESVGNNENLNVFVPLQSKRISGLTVLKDKFEIYNQRFIFVISSLFIKMVFILYIFNIYCIVRSIKFVIRVGAGSANARLVLNYRDKRHI